MNETHASITAAIAELEREIERRQQALALLRQALKLMDGNAPQPSAPPAENLGEYVDRYIASLQDGDGFTVDDLVDEVLASGVESSGKLRSKINSILSRRVKNKIIERVGERGSYAKPDKVY